jgi:hypothetical protein
MELQTTRFLRNLSVPCGPWFQHSFDKVLKRPVVLTRCQHVGFDTTRSFNKMSKAVETMSKPYQIPKTQKLLTLISGSQEMSLETFFWKEGRKRIPAFPVWPQEIEMARKRGYNSAKLFLPFLFFGNARIWLYKHLHMVTRVQAAYLRPSAAAQVARMEKNTRNVFLLEPYR